MATGTRRRLPIIFSMIVSQWSGARWGDQIGGGNTRAARLPGAAPFQGLA
jgi:hypothetical protein